MATDYRGLAFGQQYFPEEESVTGTVFPNEPFLYGDLNPYRSETEKFRTRFDPTQIQAAPEKTGIMKNLWEGTKDFASNFSPTGILNTLTGRKGADQSFGGYPGGWESRAGLFPNEVTNLQRLADKGYLAGGGKDIFGTNVVSWKGDYNKAMEKQLGVFKDTVGKKEGIENLDELEKYYLDTYGDKSRLYNKLRHVRGWNQPGDGTEQKTYLDKIQTTTPKTTTTGGSSTPREMEIARRGGYNPSAQSFSSHSPGGISQATSRAARGDPTGTGGGWGLAQGGRAGYREGQFVDEDINIQGPGFDVNENVMMASAPDPMDALNDMSMNIFGKPLNLLNEEEYQMLIDMANDQASMGQDEGIASLV